MNTAETQGLVGIFTSMEDVEASLTKLDETGFPVDQLSVIGRDLESSTEIHGFVSTGDVAKTGAGVGAWVGGVFGALTGAAVLFVPGFGPLVVAGSLAAAVLAAVEGAALGAGGGGALGAVVGHFVAKRHIPKYAEHLEAGRYLLVADGDDDQLAEARRILEGNGAKEVTYHSQGE